MTLSGHSSWQRCSLLWLYLLARPARAVVEVAVIIVEEINSAGVPCFTGSCPEKYREKAFVDAGYVPEQRLPVAKELGETSLMFLVHPTLEPKHTHLMADVVEDVAKRAVR